MTWKKTDNADSRVSWLDMPRKNLPHFTSFFVSLYKSADFCCRALYGGYARTAAAPLLAERVQIHPHVLYPAPPEDDVSGMAIEAMQRRRVCNTLYGGDHTRRESLQLAPHDQQRTPVIAAPLAGKVYT